MSAPAAGALARAWREDARRVRATLVRLLGDFEAAEEALADAFAAAAAQWPAEGEPANPYAWLVSTGRFKAIDRWRRRSRLEGALADLGRLAAAEAAPVPEAEPEIADDELRLIFTCCHPRLAPDARVALTLREVCGLTTEEIARAYLAPPPTIAQRIVRAKAKIRDERLPYDVPSSAELPARVESVLQVVYLIFNEGYAATAGEALVRTELCAEAIRLGRLVVRLVGEPEAVGLLALMLLQDSRRRARGDAAGDLVLLEDQDRALWDQDQIAEGCGLVERALRSRRFGPLTLQAAIAAVHAEAASWAQTDWAQIVALYDVLVRADPSPVVRLNRAAARGMLSGPQAGLQEIDAVLRGGALDGYHLAHAARADMLRRLGRLAEARADYRRALDLARQAPERRFLERRLAELG
jgi:RNA polymerase sigma-70 factor (ECF subfamily)